MGMSLLLNGNRKFNRASRGHDKIRGKLVAHWQDRSHLFCSGRPDRVTFAWLLYY